MGKIVMHEGKHGIYNLTIIAQLPLHVFSSVNRFYSRRLCVCVHGARA